MSAHDILSCKTRLYYGDLVSSVGNSMLTLNVTRKRRYRPI